MYKPPPIREHGLKVRIVFFFPIKMRKILKHQLGIEALQKNSRLPCSTCNPSSVAFVTKGMNCIAINR
jgi:hypothetical protein